MAIFNSKLLNYQRVTLGDPTSRNSAEVVLDMARQSKSSPQNWGISSRAVGAGSGSELKGAERLSVNHS